MAISDSKLKKSVLLYHQGILVLAVLSILINLIGKTSLTQALSIITSGLTLVLFIYSIVLLKSLISQKIPEKKFYVIPVVTIVYLIYSFCLGIYVVGSLKSGAPLPYDGLILLNLIYSLKYLSWAVELLQVTLSIYIIRKISIK